MFLILTRLLQEQSNVCLLPSTKSPLIIAISFAILEPPRFILSFVLAGQAGRVRCRSWFALTLPALKWLMAQKNLFEVCKCAARYNEFGHNPYASVIAFFSKKDNHKILYPFPNDNPQNKIGKDVLFVDRKLQCRRFIKISSLRKQLTFCYTTTGFPVKWRLRNERRKSILMTCDWEI